MYTQVVNIYNRKLDEMQDSYSSVCCYRVSITYGHKLDQLANCTPMSA